MFTEQTAAVHPANPLDAPRRAGLDDMDGLVAELAQLSRAATLDFSLSVGELIFHKVYAGSLEILRAHGPKQHSFRRLAAHPKLPFSPATLWRAVAIFELVQRFPGLAHVKHLGVAHMRAVLGLPPGAQEGLLRAAEHERWTTEDIEKQAAAHRTRMKQRGRPRVSAAERALRRLERAAGPLTTADLAALGHADEQHAERLLASIARLRGWCDTVEAGLRTGATGR